MNVNGSVVFIAGLIGVSGFELVVRPGGRQKFVRPIGSSLEVTCEATGAGSQQVRPEWRTEDGETISSTSGR